MTSWLLRGLVLAALMVVDRLIQGPLINTFESMAVWISLGLLIVFVTVPAVGWGFIDGRRDAKANPDPDRRRDLAMRWLIAGLVAGLVSGLVSYLLRVVGVPLYTDSLFNELTSFTAFTTLVVFLAAMAGVVVGRKMLDREYAKMPVRHHGLAVESYAEHQHFHNVFDAVHGDAATAAAAGATATATLTAPTDAVQEAGGDAEAAEATTEIPQVTPERPEETTGEIHLPEPTAESDAEKTAELPAVTEDTTEQTAGGSGEETS